MGTGASKQHPEVVVVVQSNEDGSIDAQVVRRNKQGNAESGASPGGGSFQVRVEDHRTQQASQRRPEISNKNYRPRRGSGTTKMHHYNGQYSSSSSSSSPVENNFLRPDQYSSSPHAQTVKEHSENSSQSGDPTQMGFSQGSDNMEFKIFQTSNNEEYTVYVREDGNMFYVDWEQQKWRVFPPEWKEHGTFKDFYEEGQDQWRSEKEGELIHPLRGKLTTILRQESLYIMYYFDENSKGWFPLPLTWERHTPFVSKLVDEIKSTCPDWKDDRSIVASLRQCNYNKDEVISFYYAINDDGVFDRFKDTSSGQSVLIEKLQKQIKELEEELETTEQSRREMKKKLSKLTDQVDGLRDENKRQKEELASIKQEQRRQSINLRNSFGHGSLRLPASTLKMNVMRPLVQGAWRESRTVKLKLQSTKQLLMKSIKGHKEQINKLSKAVEQLLFKYRSQAGEIQEARALYRKEAQQRKLLYNEIQELRGNIRVFCRCRYDNSEKCVLKFNEEDVLSCVTSQGREKKYEFEKVFSPATTQEQVFEDTCPIITSCVDGYNVCIIAYGQTGAGKTYTMMGPSDNPGVNIRSIKELFKVMKERENVAFQMKVSMVEVYNESVYNLLVSSIDVHEKLTIQQKGKNVIIVGLTEVEVRSVEDVMKVIAVGEKNRTTASTKMNTNSSRSHLLVTIQTEGFNRVSGTTTRGRLTLVDLAGSERIARSEATGQRLVEAAAINKSLSALGQVFSAIRDSALHIPYRNSKLTHLLQPCLGGDAKACMFVNVSPLQSNILETISTLEFGSNARQVALGKATKHVTKQYL